MNLHKVKRKAAMLTALVVLIKPVSGVYVPTFVKINKTANNAPNRL